MERLDEALAALETGLVYEPENAVRRVPFSDRHPLIPRFAGIENDNADHPAANKGTARGQDGGSEWVR